MTPHTPSTHRPSDPIIHHQQGSGWLCLLERAPKCLKFEQESSFDMLPGDEHVPEQSLLVPYGAFYVSLHRPDIISDRCRSSSQRELRRRGATHHVPTDGKRTQTHRREGANPPDRAPPDSADAPDSHSGFWRPFASIYLSVSRHTRALVCRNKASSHVPFALSSLLGWTGSCVPEFFPVDVNCRDPGWQ